MRSAAITLVLGLALLALAVPGARRVRDARPSAQDRDGAVEAVQRFVQMSVHLVRSGGDPRFAERVPAAKPIVDEILGDVAFLQHGGRAERPDLVRLDVKGVEPGEADEVTVFTREYWIVQDVRLSVGEPAGSQRADVVDVRYDVAPGAGGWRVERWTIDSRRSGADGARGN